ncbi:hypothetical protein D9M68_136350 [compost metagenome]
MDVAKTAEAVARASYGKLVAFLAARTRDIAGAQDALSEAVAAALADWPRSGIPRTPEAWLMTVAKRKLIDAAGRPASQRGGKAVVPPSCDCASSGHPSRDDAKNHQSLLPEADSPPASSTQREARTD